MRRFWLGFGAALGLLSVVWLLGVRHQLGVPTGSSRWVFDANQHKTKLAIETPGVRTLIVAGSNAMFGIDSGQIEQLWQRTAINLAVNAGLGLPYILENSKRVARAGDIILLPLEYALILDDGSPNAQIIDYVIARDLDYWRSLSRFTQLQFAAEMAPDRWIEGLRRLPDGPNSNGRYGAHFLDARGDQTHTDKTDQTAADMKAVSQAKIWNYGKRARAERGAWHLLADYASWAKNAGVCVIAIPTVLLKQEKYTYDQDDYIFYTTLAQKMTALGIPYIGSPLDFMYPPSWFFDTDHHLQAWARRRHTSSLVTLLQANALPACPTPQAKK